MRDHRMRVGHMSALVVACLAACHMRAVFGAEPDDSERLLREIERSTTYREQAELFDRVSLDSQLRGDVARKLLGLDSERTRAFGVVLAIGVRSDDERAALLKRGSADREPTVAHLAFLGMLLSNVPTTPEEHERIARSKDIVGRAALALAAGDFNVLKRSIFDKNAFVRACAARRVVRIQGKIPADRTAPPHGDTAAEEILDVLLADPDRLVRGNALIAARGIRYRPVGTLRGLVADDDGMIEIVEFFGNEAEVRGNRKTYGLAEEPDWDTSLLGMLVFDRTRPIRQISGRIILINEQLLIGTEAADFLLDQEAARTRGHIAWIAESHRTPRLRRQLEGVLRNLRP